MKCLHCSQDLPERVVLDGALGILGKRLDKGRVPGPAWRRLAARIMAGVPSAARRDASRANGALGGRPRTVAAAGQPERDALPNT